MTSPDPLPEPVLQRFPWALRLAGIAASLVILALVLRRLEPAALRQAFAQFQLPWFALAFLGFGLALLPAAFRWHALLELNRCPVHLGASLRLTYIGHFFATLLVGPASGDIPKAALYNRWFQHSTSDTLAASTVDRLMSGAGGLLFALCAVLLGALTGGFSFLRTLRLEPPSTSTTLALALALLAAIAFLHRYWHKPDSFIGRTLRSLRRLAYELHAHPRVSAKALALSFTTVAVLTVSQICALQAIAPQPLPWFHLFWALHLATMIASLPITIAGAGLREGALILLLKFYNIPAPVAVAAGLIILSIHASWALLGVLLWTTEQRRRARHPPPAPVQSISFLLPAPPVAATSNPNPNPTPKPPIDWIERTESHHPTRHDEPQNAQRSIAGNPFDPSRWAALRSTLRGDAIAWCPVAADPSAIADARERIFNALRDPLVGGGLIALTPPQPAQLIQPTRIREWLRTALLGRTPHPVLWFVRSSIPLTHPPPPGSALLHPFLATLRHHGRIARL